MPWISAAVAIGGSLISGSMASDAAGEASDAATKSTEAATAEQRRQYDLNRADQAQYMQTGNAANARLAYLMGLSPNSGGGQNYNKTYDQFRQELAGRYGGQPSYGGATSGGIPDASAGFTGGRGLLGKAQAAYAAGARPDPNAPQLLGVDQGHSDEGNVERWGPATQQYGGPQMDEAGLDAAIRAAMAQQDKDRAAAEAGAAGDSSYGSLSRRFTMADRDADPVYQSGLQFGLDQGTGAVNARAIQQGGYDSGATLKALTRYANDYGTTKAEGAYNRFNTDNTNLFNRLSGLSGTGQTATNQVATAGTNTANNISNLTTDAGTARAAGIVGAGNAWTNAVGNVANTGSNYFRNLLTSNPYATTSTVPMQPGGGY